MACGTDPTTQPLVLRYASAHPSADAVHHHLGGGVANDDQPVARAGGPIDRSAVEIDARDGVAAVDLLLKHTEASALHLSTY